MHVNIAQQPGGDSCNVLSITAHSAPSAKASCSTGHAPSRFQSCRLSPAFPVNGKACGSQFPQARAFRHLSTAHVRCRHLRPSLVCGASSPQRQQVDTAMIWGDILMLTATNLASERLPRHLTGVLSLTLLAAWIGVATAKGDYTMKGSRNFSFQYAYSIVLGMQQAAITWLLFVPTAMAMYACLVSHHLLDSGVFRVPPGARVSPEGEVMIAALFTLMSWRGIYSSQLF